VWYQVSCRILNFPFVSYNNVVIVLLVWCHGNRARSDHTTEEPGTTHQTAPPRPPITLLFTFWFTVPVLVQILLPLPTAPPITTATSPDPALSHTSLPTSQCWGGGEHGGQVPGQGQGVHHHVLCQEQSGRKREYSYTLQKLNLLFVCCCCCCCF